MEVTTSLAEYRETLARPALVVISPNHNGARPRTLGVIMHSTRGGVNDGGDYWRTIGWFKRPDAQASAHRVIGRNQGEHCQMVSDLDIAWHAARDNLSYLGIELVQETLDTAYTLGQLETAAGVVAAWLKAFGLVASEETIRRHSDTEQGQDAGKSDPGALFPYVWFINRVRELMND